MKKRNFKIFIVLICLISSLLGCGTQYLDTDRDEKWKKDISYLEKALPRNHVYMFSNITEKDFSNQMEILKNKVTELNDYEIKSELTRIVASVSDGHTKVYYDTAKKFPITFYYFDEGIYVTNVCKTNEQAFKCRLIKINGIDIKDIEKKLTPYIAIENNMSVKKNLPKLLCNADILYGSHIINDINKAEYTFENSDGKIIKINLKSLDSKEDTKADEKQLIQKYDKSYPLYMQNIKSSYWYKYLENEKILYFKYNSCTYYDDNELNVEDLYKKIFKIIDEGKVEKLVLDIRNNGGGSDGALNNFRNEIKKRKINNKKQFFVVVNRNTFSAAIINAEQLRQETNATFLGEATAERVNHYGAVDVIVLPNSQIEVTYSTKKCNISKKDEDAFYPDVKLNESAKDYFNKKDVVMEYIEDYK